MTKGLLKSLNSKFHILNSRHCGFTLVELMVAVGIFVILTGIAVGGFARAIRTQRQIQALLAANSNASLAIETMARDMRTGRYFCASGPLSSDPNVVPTYKDCLPRSDSSGSYSALAFVNSSGQEVAYCLTADGIIRKTDVAAPGFSSCDSSSGSTDALTSGNAKITYLTFLLSGNNPGGVSDGYPPRITILMGVSPNSLDPALAGSVINLQTTVSSRQPDS